jgi:hypothetical protein
LHRSKIPLPPPQKEKNQIHLLLNLQIEQLDEIKEIIEMKVAHRKNIKRRKQKFGYESNSLIGLDMSDALIAQVAQEDDQEENPFEDT